MKNNMNKILVGVLVVAAVTAGFFVAQKNQPSVENPTSDKLVALSSFTIIADMVAEIGGDKVVSTSLTKPGANIHGYEPTPSDLIQASKAEIFFENGLNLELWTSKLKASIPNVPAVKVSEGVELVSIEEGPYMGKPNPHAWMSPKQGLLYIENIRKGLTEAAPQHEAYFRERADAYAAKLIALDKELASALEALPAEQRYLVTCEGAFTYLTNDYHLNEVYLWAINSDAGASPQQIAKVIDIVKSNKIPAVFCESTVAADIQEGVASASGAEMGGVLFVDSLSGPEGPASTYLTLLEHTVKTIIEGLTVSN